MFFSSFYTKCYTKFRMHALIEICSRHCCRYNSRHCCLYLGDDHPHFDNRFDRFRNLRWHTWISSSRISVRNSSIASSSSVRRSTCEPPSNFGSCEHFATVADVYVLTFANVMLAIVSRVVDECLCQSWFGFQCYRLCHFCRYFVHGVSYYARHRCGYHLVIYHGVFSWLKWTVGIKATVASARPAAVAADKWFLMMIFHGGEWWFSHCSISLLLICFLFFFNFNSYSINSISLFIMWNVIGCVSNTWNATTFYISAAKAHLSVQFSQLGMWNFRWMPCVRLQCQLWIFRW